MASAVNRAITADPITRQPEGGEIWDLPCCSRSLLNHFWTGQDLCTASLPKWRLTLCQTAHMMSLRSWAIS